MENPDLPIPFVEECGMNWKEIVDDYNERMLREKELGIDIIKEEYRKIIDNIKSFDLDEFLEGNIPGELSKIVELDPVTSNFVSRKYP